MDKIVELKNISKLFPGVLALDDVSIDIKRGEVHGLLGENGAGKSTLIKCLAGIHQPDQGEIRLNGEKVILEKPRKAIDLGISCIYQELNSIPELSVTDNIFIGQYKKSKAGFLDYKAMNDEATKLLKKLGQEINPRMKIRDLGIGQQQMVEIAKSLSRNAKFIIMDEPTASLSQREIKELLKVIRLLVKEGVTILFISHKLEEIFQVCDRVSILRDGQWIITESVDQMTNEQLISHMVGRTLNDLIPKIKSIPKEEMLRVENLSRYGVYNDISFSVKGGEVLGVSGLVGAGRTEVFRGVFGLDDIDGGKIFINNKEVTIQTPMDAIKHKIAFVTEDRKDEGLVLNESVLQNLVMVALKQFSKKIKIDHKLSEKKGMMNIESLKIKVASMHDPVGQLSGGNQQKVVIGKWLNTDADIYIFDEPTRGIDIGAKIEVYNLMNELTANGKAVIMISSELPEILGMSDRVIIMREGELMGEIQSNHPAFNQETIMKAAWGGSIHV